jgi:hypothetical protein
VNSAATTTADITPLAITGSVTVASRVYDSGVDATITGRTLSGVLGTDNVSLVGGTATFADKNAGSGKTVTVTGLSLSGADAGNYTVNSTATTTADITAAPLMVTNITADSRVYDGGTDAVIHTTGATLTGVFGSDDVSLDAGGATGAFADKNAGTAKTVTIGGLGLTGADAGNYVLTPPSTTADITPLAITGSVTVASRVYDGGVDATIAGRTLSGVLGTDNVSLVGGTATFADKNVGSGKTVTVTGLSLSGANAANYTVNSTETTTANITAATLTVTGIAAADKPFDGTTAATLDTSGDMLVGVIGNDAVTLSVAGAVGNFDTPDIGTNKTVFIIGLTISGTDAGNYSLTQPTTTASIT